MSNKHTFDSVRTVERRHFDSIVRSTRAYNSSIIKGRFYNGFLSNFTQYSGLIALFSQKNTIFLDFFQDIFVSASLSSGSVVMSVDRTKTTTEIFLNPTFAQTNVIRATMSQNDPNWSALFTQNNTINSIMSDKLIISSVDLLDVGAINISASMTAFVGEYLSTYDPQLLSDLDANLLSTMDGTTT
jgi:hypothetical protein